MAVTDSPQWHLAPSELAPREGFGVLLQYPDPVLSVLLVEVKAQANPRAGGSRAYNEGEKILLCRPHKYRVIHLSLVYYLTDRQPTPVNFRIVPVHAATVCLHGPCGEFHFILRAGYLTSESHLIRFFHPRALHRHGLLQHPRP